MRRRPWRPRRPGRSSGTPGETGERYRDLVLAFGATDELRPGEQRLAGRSQASGVEVEAWQPYTPGDDLRHLDWPALARLDALLVRRFVAEREVVVHLVLDASASMADEKATAAAELLAALAAIALANGHSVRVVVLAGGRPPWTSILHRRAASLRAIATVLDTAAPSGALDLATALGEWALARPERAATVVVSDLLLEPTDLLPALRALGAGGVPRHLVQVLGPAELRPETRLHPGLLTDAETGATHPIALDPPTLAEYRALLAAHRRALCEIAATSGSRYACLELPRPVADFIRDDLVRTGLVRPRSR